MRCGARIAVVLTAMVFASGVLAILINSLLVASGYGGIPVAAAFVGCATAGMVALALGRDLWLRDGSAAGGARR